MKYVLLIWVAIILLIASASALGTMWFVLVPLFTLSIVTFLLFDGPDAVSVDIQPQLLIAVAYLIVFGASLFCLTCGIDYNLSSLITELSTVGNAAWMQIIILAFSAAIWEEIAFRRVFLNLLRLRMNDGLAIFISSLCFLAYHTPPKPMLFLTGVFNSIVALRYNSLLVPIFLHAIYNCTGRLSQQLPIHAIGAGGRFTNEEILRGTNAISSIVFFCLIMSFLILEKLLRRQKPSAISDSLTG